MPSLAFLDFCCEETGRGSEGQLGFVGGEFAEDLGGGRPGNLRRLRDTTRVGVMDATTSQSHRGKTNASVWPHRCGFFGCGAHP